MGENGDKVEENKKKDSMLHQEAENVKCEKKTGNGI